jgi:Tfp pilus assembly protein PilN
MRAVNLLPRDEPRRKAQGLSLQAQLMTVAPVLAVIALGSAWYVSNTQVYEHRTKLDALNGEIARLPAPKQAPTIDPTLRAEHDTRVAALAAALAQRVAWDRILRQISSLLPEDVWLTGIDAKSPVVPAAPAAPAPTTTDTTATSTDSSAAAASPPPPPPPPPPSSSTDVAASPLAIKGYTYSQPSVARFLARLAVIPELSDVKLVSSSLTDIGERQVVEFQIVADLRAPGAS